MRFSWKLIGSCTLVALCVIVAFNAVSLIRPEPKEFSQGLIQEQNHRERVVREFQLKEIRHLLKVAQEMLRELEQLELGEGETE